MFDCASADREINVAAAMRHVFIVIFLMMIFLNDGYFLIDPDSYRDDLHDYLLLC